MSDIAPISHLAGGRHDPVPGSVEREPTRPGSGARAPRPSDRVELSDRARFLSKLADLPAVRSELVDSVRREIAEGTYDSSRRLDEAIRHLAEDLELGD